jgi:hypothetical protein
MFLTACDKEDTLVPTEDFGMEKKFAPSADAPDIVSSIYDEYGMWVRMDFEEASEVENAMLDKDLYNRGSVTKIEDEYKPSAYKYIETLLDHIPGEFAKKHLPLDLFVVETYGRQPWWGQDMYRFGRSRFLLTWPNQMRDALPVDLTDYDNHYYQDSVLTATVLSNLTSIMSLRIEPVKEIETAGWAYGNEKFAKINDTYSWNDPNRKIAYAELEREGGFVSASGSKSFEVDLSQWMTAIMLLSSEQMKEKFLDNSPKRAAKYLEIVKYFNAVGWDIQAAGDNFSQMREEHKRPAED